VCLQETKCVDESFPREPLEALGYNVAVHGQKTFNGVAILSKLPLDEVTPRLPGDPEDDHARFIEAVVSTKTGALRVASIYLPNGNPPNTDKYPYKLRWMQRLFNYAHERLELEEPLVLAGDYNVIPADADVHNSELWRGDALFLPETRTKFRALKNLGLTDAIRANTDDPGLYTFWDYQAGAWQKNNGIRIDHLLLSAQAADRLVTAGIDKYVRAWEKPSDHVPVWIDLDLEAR
jgi:exodeoxyribonuclease-3